MITVSLVLHDRFYYLPNIIKELISSREVTEVIVRFNVREVPLLPFRLHPKIVLIQNLDSVGFGQNHNRNFAARFRSNPVFCIMNPDVMFDRSVFKRLLATMKEYNLGLVSPAVTDHKVKSYSVQRPDLTFVEFCLQKVFGTLKSTQSAMALTRTGEVQLGGLIAGTFLLCESSVFEDVAGFDESFFLYYEDFDLCRRLLRADIKIGVDYGCSILHFAGRTSHRNVRHLFIHVRSLVRYFFVTR